jgi:hypothetical protein
LRVLLSCFGVGLQAARAKVRTTGTKVKRMLAMGFLLGVDVALRSVMH